MVIPEYFACLDGLQPLSGLELVEPDVEFLIALPDHEVSGCGKEDLGAYIAGRPAVGRRHRVLRAVADRDLEMVYGQVVEGDGVGTGSFVSVGLVSPAGRLARYKSFFHPEFGMYPLPAATVVTP
ncbi:conserved hypothetical protein [Parafrankia sp. EAN1pec]|uniref:hypothetical protein n=1 Tax=Parafrankia sp. (strain EAN1pec) TaxID=298653 RepID=UPI00015D9E96|nr:conserved hypothetical protein [Frankia sp. EAN1pec]